MTKLSKVMSLAFVEDYKEFKSSMDIVNTDLTKSKIPFQYTYDEFCIAYRKETKRNMNFIVYFGEEHLDLTGCWQFNLFNLRSMLKRKLKNSATISKSSMNSPF